jgi:hypothetical protein
MKRFNYGADIVRRLPLACLIVGATLALAACMGGGSGGGGGGSPIAPRSTFSVSEVTDGMPNQGALSDDYSNSGDSGGLEAALTGGNYLEGTAGEAGQNIHVEHGASMHVTLGSSTVVFATGNNGDSNLYGNGGTQLAAGEKDVDQAALDIMNEARPTSSIDELLPPGSYTDLLVNDRVGAEERFTGTIAYGKQILTLNSGLVDLEHSSFGSWAIETMFSGTFKGDVIGTITDDYREIISTPVSGGDSNALKSPQANDAFTGKAMAMATDYKVGPAVSPAQKFFTGDAALTVNGAGNGGNLALSFPNFYDIGFALTVSGSGFQATTGSIPTVTDNGNTSGITLNQATIERAKNPGAADAHDTYLTGNFYGSGANAGEATGRFNVFDENGSGEDSSISGSFGVKK